MAREKFVNIAFRESSLAVIAQADKIIGEYQRRGYTLTLRQLYYQFVSRDLIKNAQSEYKRLGKIINDGRMAGLLDWSAIEDRTRNVRKPPAWSSPGSIIDAVADQYQENLWESQSHYVEVWIEKDALVGVIEGVCGELRVPYFACRGYASQSELYDAGKRLSKMSRGGPTLWRAPVILHLGDHDPSGLDMTRDVEARLNLFYEGRGDVEVRRLALNMDQIDKYDPPPNPAKDTDARFISYQEEYGDSSWELDALDPDVISDLIRNEIDGLLDHDAFEAAREQEETSKKRLELVSRNWNEVAEWTEQEFGDDEEPT